MSLIDLRAPVQTPAAEVQAIRNLTAQIYRTLRMQHTQAFNRVWNNPNFTAAEIVSAFGTDALALFQLSGAIQQILKTADQEYVPLVPPLAFTTNADGTVSVNA